MEFENVVRWFGAVEYLEYDAAIKEIERRLKRNNLPITLMINSEGGILPLAHSFCEEIRMRKIPINTVVMGRADSAAIPLVLLGKKRVMSRDAHILFHPLEFHEQEEAKKKENLTDWYLNFIAKESRMTISEVKNLISESVLLNPEECKNRGLIHQIQ